jgi:four helix bundle protein
MHTYYFEKLTVWQDSKQLVIDIYRTTKRFPNSEKYGLISQLQRAAVSVSANISEGSARNTSKDQLNFFNIAFASLMEVLNLLIIAHELGYLDHDTYTHLRSLIDKTANKLNALKKKVNQPS